MFTKSKVLALRILSNSNFYILKMYDVPIYLMHDNMKLRMLNYSFHYLLSIQGEYFHVYKNTYIHTICMCIYYIFCFVDETMTLTAAAAAAFVFV